MKKTTSLALIILLCNFCIAQKHVTTYYDYSKIHPREDYYTNSAGQKSGAYKAYNQNGVVVQEYNYLNGEMNGLCVDYQAKGTERWVAAKATYKNGVQDGYFIKYDSDNDFRTKWKDGYYKTGKESGTWKEWWGGEGLHPDVIKLICQYSNGQLNGSWKLYSEKGSLITKGSYVAGQKNGMWYIYDASDSTKVLNSGEYANGTRVGPWTIYMDKGWSETDNPQKYAFYRKITFDNAGNPTNDKVQDFYISGTKQWEGYLSSVNPDVYNHIGVSIYYFENGKEQLEQDFDKGIQKDFYQSGTVKGEYDLLKDGSVTGKGKVYSESGKLTGEGSMAKGKFVGYWKFYFDNGLVSEEGEYVNDFYKGVVKKGIWKAYYESGKIKTITDYGANGSANPSVDTYDEKGNKKRSGGLWGDKKNQESLEDRENRLNSIH